MNTFDQDAFNRFVLDNGVYGFFEQPITLKSGRLSHFYANWRTVVEDAWLTERLAGFVISYVQDRAISVDTFYGVPEGATKLGVLTQFLWARRDSGYAIGSHALAMGRAWPKEHGAVKDKLFVGPPRGKVVVLEDVTTTGGSSLAEVSRLQEGGFSVSALISLTNRMEKRPDGSTVAEAAGKLGVKFHSMSSAIDLLPRAYSECNPGEAIARAIEAEFDDFGVSPVVLGD